MCRRLVRAGLLTLALLLCGGVAALAQAPGPDEPLATLREGFESPRPSWRQEDADVTLKLLAHDRSERARHDGRFSEHFHFVGEGLGSSVYYSLALPPVPVLDGLEISLYVRSNQPGVRLLAQVILPGDIDPETGEPSFVRIAGGMSEEVDRWQRLEIADVMSAVKEQARILRVQTRRKVDLEGAYIDRLIVNLYGGAGETEVFLDDLTITPVPESVVAAFRAGDTPVTQVRTQESIPSAAGFGTETAPAPTASTGGGGEAGPRVRLDGGRLTRDGRDWFPSILDAPGADLDRALILGFDVVKVDLAPGIDPERLRGLVDSGALLMPGLGAGGQTGEAPLDDPQGALNIAATFPLRDSVAFWSLGEGLGGSSDPEHRRAELERTRGLVTALRDQPRGFPSLATAGVGGEFPKYALPGQSLDLIGVEARTWGTMLSPQAVAHYLEQRRDLTALWNLNAPYWAWVDAAVPQKVRAAVWGEDIPPAWGSARVQPEQVRLGAFTALMAGYRGVGFRADAELTRASGQAVFFELGLLNAEIDLIEPILARAGEAGPIATLLAYPTPPKRQIVFNVGASQGSQGRFDDKPTPEMTPLPTVRVASIPSSDGRSRLVLIADLAAHGQWQPPQMAYNDLRVTVPGAPASVQAYELSLGGRRVLERSRPPGGVAFTLPEFGTTAMVLLTTDQALAEHLQARIEALRPWAVDLAIRQARLQLEWVAETNGRLALDGRVATDAADLLARAESTLRSAIELQSREEYEESWNQARRVGRSLRVLMRQHWDQAAAALAEAARESLDPQRGRNGTAARGTTAGAGEQPFPTIAPPVASPPLMAFNTLPQHYVWCDWVRQGTYGKDLLDGGGTFDGATPATLDRSGWTDAGYRPEKVAATIRLVSDSIGGKPPTPAPAAVYPGARPRPAAGQVLELGVEPDAPGGIDGVPGFLDHPAAAVQSPPVPVRARQMVRIRVLVRMPRAMPPGAGGLIVRDSIGGERLQYQTTLPIADWSEVVLFRRAPTDGELTVTLGLAGFGKAYFDDLRIEPLEQYTPASYAVAPAAPVYYAPPRPDVPAAAIRSRIGPGGPVGFSRTVR